MIWEENRHITSLHRMLALNDKVQSMSVVFDSCVLHTLILTSNIEANGLAGAIVDSIDDLTSERPFVVTCHTDYGESAVPNTKPNMVTGCNL
jgi:hypothetical protein